MTLDIWKPGSFTKNFSWGNASAGLSQLHAAIRTGFDNTLEDVPRNIFRLRVKAINRPDFIPLNFFLFNKQVDGRDVLVADELVFQALNYEHSTRFDHLALFAFNLSFVGKWKGSDAAQRRPALWANAYIRERVARDFNWNVSQVTADDIEKFVSGDPRYLAKTSRKLATNLAYLFRIGRLRQYSEVRIKRWWVDSLFLCLDRLIEDRRLDGRSTSETDYFALLASTGFLDLTGPRTLEKEIAIKHLVHLYSACGGRERFSAEQVQERANVLVQDLEQYIANDWRPRGAVQPTNPRILKSIPAACAMLAKYAGFDVIDPEETENFDIDAYIRTRTNAALEELKRKNIKPTMSAEDLTKLTRGQ